VLGLSANCLYLSYYHDKAEYDRLATVAFTINVAWGWITFATNTVLTVAIMGKIL
jgi:hypothetical protein